MVYSFSSQDDISAKPYSGVFRQKSFYYTMGIPGETSRGKRRNCWKIHLSLVIFCFISILSYKKKSSNKLCSHHWITALFSTHKTLHVLACQSYELNSFFLNLQWFDRMICIDFKLSTPTQMHISNSRKMYIYRIHIMCYVWTYTQTFELRQRPGHAFLKLLILMVFH